MRIRMSLRRRKSRQTERIKVDYLQVTTTFLVTVRSLLSKPPDPNTVASIRYFVKPLSVLSDAGE